MFQTGPEADVWRWDRLFQTGGANLSVKASGVANTCLLSQVWQRLPV